MLEKTLESPLDCKEIKPVNPEGNQSWIFIGRTDAEAETPILWPPDAKSWLIWKDSDARKDRRQKEKGTTEDEMVGWLHWLDGHEFEQAPAIGEGQGSLGCCSPWGCRESDMTEQMNWTEKKRQSYGRSKKISSCQRMWGMVEEWISRWSTEDFLGQWKHSLWYSNGGHMSLYICPNPSNALHQHWTIM